MRRGIDLVGALERDPLLAYVFEAWSFHVHAGLDASAAKDPSAKFVKECQALPVFTTSGDTRSFDILGPLHILALYKLPVALIDIETMGNPNAITPKHRQTPLIIASLSGHEDLVEKLIALAEVQVNSLDAWGRSALIWAVSEGHETIVQLLLVHSAIQVNRWDDFKVWPLMYAAQGGHEGIVKLLLTHRHIQVNQAREDGLSPLMEAARNGRQGIVKILLEHPASQPKSVDIWGLSAMMHAASWVHKTVVGLFFSSAGAVNVNAIDNRCNSAIKMAAFHGHAAVVRLLLQAPDIDTKIRSTSDGYTAMSAAEANGYNDIVELLRDFEVRRTAALAIDSLSPHERNDKVGSDSGSESGESYYDAEEGEEVEGAGSDTFPPNDIR
jgi:ankyrin repeat protein